MRYQFILFLKDRGSKETKEVSIMNKEGAIEKRLIKMKNEAEYRLMKIDEFKQTLEKMELSERVKET